MQTSDKSAVQGPGSWDTQYEWKAVALLAAGFGLVGLDRMVVSPLFPVIQKDLNLNYQDIGNIAAVLALAWGITSLFVGQISDRLGRRAVLIPAVLAYSLLGGLTGLATSLGMLLLIRTLLGVAEGAYAPMSNVAAVEASHPNRRARNLGLVLLTYFLLSGALAPIVATQLLDVLPSWRWVFILVALPGFVVAALLYKVLRDTQGSLVSHESAPSTTERLPWTQIFRYRNIRLNLIAVFCMMTCIFVIAAMMPNYLTDHIKLSVQQMGFVMSGFGFGACFGYLFMPALSDKLGRKPLVLAGFLGTLISLWMLLQTGNEPVLLFAWMFLAAVFVAAMSSNILTPITVESVPPTLSGTATGIVNGVGEIIGGAAAPAGAGFVATQYGIQHALTVALIAAGIGFLISWFFIETAPSRTARKLASESQAA